MQGFLHDTKLRGGRFPSFSPVSSPSISCKVASLGCSSSSFRPSMVFFVPSPLLSWSPSIFRSIYSHAPRNIQLVATKNLFSIFLQPLPTAARKRLRTAKKEAEAIRRQKNPLMLTRTRKGRSSKGTKVNTYFACMHGRSFPSRAQVETVFSLPLSPLGWGGKEGRASALTFRVHLHPKCKQASSSLSLPSPTRGGFPGRLSLSFGHLVWGRGRPVGVGRREGKLSRPRLDQVTQLG